MLYGFEVTCLKLILLKLILASLHESFVSKAYFSIQIFSLNWQHQLCKNPRPNPDIKTLFTDHSCTPTTANGARPPPPANNPLLGPIPKAGAFPPIGAHGVSIFASIMCQVTLVTSHTIRAMVCTMQPFQPVVSPSPGSIAGWMSSNNPSLPHPAVAAGPPSLVQPSSAGKTAIGYVVYWALSFHLFVETT